MFTFPFLCTLPITTPTNSLFLSALLEHYTTQGGLSWHENFWPSDQIYRPIICKSVSLIFSLSYTCLTCHMWWVQVATQQLWVNTPGSTFTCCHWWFGEQLAHWTQLSPQTSTSPPVNCQPGLPLLYYSSSSLLVFNHPSHGIPFPPSANPGNTTIFCQAKPHHYFSWPTNTTIFPFLRLSEYSPIPCQQVKNLWAKVPLDRTLGYK